MFQLKQKCVQACVSYIFGTLDQLQIIVNRNSVAAPVQL